VVASGCNIDVTFRVVAWKRTPRITVVYLVRSQVQAALAFEVRFIWLWLPMDDSLGRNLPELYQVVRLISLSVSFLFGRTLAMRLYTRRRSRLLHRATSQYLLPSMKSRD